MRQTFLAEVASKLYEQYHREISSLKIVLPSRRARLFFSEALSQLSDKPLWQPEYLSMDDVTSQATSLKPGEKIRLITELYKIYSKHHNESFDKFYFWGEILLADFDLIDKYMIDADMLFRNISDLKELEADISYLTPEMRQTINTFWGHFNNEASLSEEKHKFLAIWLSLAPIYHEFKFRLTQLGFAYPGMIYRSAAENIKCGATAIALDKSYIFIGFNALSECEKRILRHIQTNSNCQFFWDYDSYYTSADGQHQEQEAGRFLCENIKEFKPQHTVSHDNFLGIKKDFTAISTVSNIVQCKYVNTILKEIATQTKLDKHTAIVLTDESLLDPLLHSLPQEIIDGGNVNVTMGYPLRQTTAYSFIERLIELQRNCRTSDAHTNFYHVDVVGILSHPYITEIEPRLSDSIRCNIFKQRCIRVDKEIFAESAILSKIFSVASSWSELSEYMIEVIDAICFQSEENLNDNAQQKAYLGVIAKNINEITNCVNKCDLELTNSTFVSLLRRHLQTVRIPYSGEPLQGLQVMGILETRNLDFENVIILSMNDDNFPGNITNSASFIPYNLRAAYGIPTPEHHESVYAYYFYRLIQRAKNVYMLYCSHADEKSTGEQSRYIYQLDYESGYTIQRRNVGVDVKATEVSPIVVKKEGPTLEKLMHLLDKDSPKMLSPKAISPYIACPLKFYFSSIAKLKPSEELIEQVDNPMFGTILHAATESLYKPLIGIANPRQQLELLLKGQKIEKAVEQAINSEFLNRKDATAEQYSGSLILIKQIVSNYIRKQIIPFDIQHCNFSVMHLERCISSEFKLANGKRVIIGGYADRIDSLDNGNIRVVDYKTGARHLEINGVESLFEGENRQSMGNILQTMLYSMVLNHSHQRNVEPALYFVRYMQAESYNPHIIDKGSKDRPDAHSGEVDYAHYAAEFEQLLSEKLSELFNPDIPFTQCDASEASKICQHCDFKTICKR